MPISVGDFKDLTKEVKALSQTLSEIKGSIKTLKIVGGVVLPFLTAALIGAFVWCFRLATVVAVLQTGGDTKLLTALASPRSAQQLEASLSTVVAQIQTARADGKRPSPAKVAALSDALVKVTNKNPDLPEAWDAAFQLVNYRSETPSPLSASADDKCHTDDTLARDQLEATIAAGEDKGNNYYFLLRNCTFNLDMPASYEQTSMAKFFQVLRAAHPQDPRVLRIDNAVITYSGGKIIPVDEIVFVNCVFRFNTPREVDPRGQDLTRQLLSSDLAHTTIRIPEVGM